METCIRVNWMERRGDTEGTTNRNGFWVGGQIAL